MNSEHRKQSRDQRTDRKLTVRRDTLRQLTDGQLRRIVGGTWSHRGNGAV